MDTENVFTFKLKYVEVLSKVRGLKQRKRRFTPLTEGMFSDLPTLQVYSITYVFAKVFRFLNCIFTHKGGHHHQELSEYTLDD